MVHSYDPLSRRSHLKQAIDHEGDNQTLFIKNLPDVYNQPDSPILYKTLTKNLLKNSKAVTILVEREKGKVGEVR